MRHPASHSILLIVLAVPLFGACSFGALKEDLKVLDSLTMMNEKVIYKQQTAHPVIVIMYEKIMAR